MTQSFTYDQLNRISTGTESDNLFNQTYTPDAWGNMSYSGGAPPAFSFTNFNQISGYCYDSSGNLLDTQTCPSGAHQYVWDSEGRMSSSNGTSSTSYTYDADGQRIRKDVGSTWTEYLYFGGEPISENSASGWTDYLFAGSKRIAQVSATATNYSWADHLKSARVMMDASANTLCADSYTPFGSELGSCGATHYKFTGKERDSETQNDYFGARYYGSTMGRFMSPDWGGPLDLLDPVPWADFESPQTLNLYSYVQNNPLSNVDPDGHDCVVQTRTDANKETVNVSSGNCDNVQVADGQTKTYIPGVVDASSIQSNGAGGITFGYTPYGGGAGVADLNGAPIPENTNLAYNWGNNAQGYQQLATAAGVINDPRTYLAWYGGSALLGGGLVAGGAVGGDLTLLGDISLTPTAGEQAYAEKILEQGGRKAVERAIRTLSKRLAEHAGKLGNLKGNPGSVEREMATFRRTIEALKQVLR